MKHFPHAGNKGVKQRKPRKRGLRKRGHWVHGKVINHLRVTMVKKGENKNKVRFKVMRNLRNIKVKLSKLISGKVILNNRMSIPSMRV